VPRKRLALPLLSVVLPCVVACAPGDEAVAVRSALIVTLDTTRADAWTCLGGAPGVTPAIDALARESVLYERARTVAPMTLPAHASMMTGLYPLRHSARDNSLNRLPRAAETLAERAAERGFETAAFVAAAVLDPGVGLAQGFETYDAIERDATAERSQHVAERPAGDVLARVRSWFDERDAGRPFLCWVHLFDPHLPYEPPAAFAEQARGDAYHGEVAYVDRAVGELVELLRARELLDSTLVIALGDHGEGLGDHDEEAHAMLVYDTTIRVPLLVRHPDGHRAGERSREIVSVVDVFPTVVDALALGRSGDVDGQSLFRRRAPADRGVYFESYYGFLQYGWSPLSGWVDTSGKYVHSSEPQLFDVDADPGERVHLLDAGHDASRHQAAIDRLAAKPRLSADDEIDGALLEDLQGLGYVTGGRALSELPHPLEPTDRPAPQHRHAVVREAFRAVDEWQRQGNFERARARLQELVDENPRNLLARERLSLLYVALERWSEAFEAARDLLAAGFETASTHNTLGLAQWRLGRLDEARVHLERALELDPRNPLVEKNLKAVRRALAAPSGGG